MKYKIIKIIVDEVLETRRKVKMQKVEESIAKKFLMVTDDEEILYKDKERDKEKHNAHGMSTPIIENEE